MLFDNGTVGRQIEWIFAVSQSSPGPAVEASMVSDPTGFLEHHRHENKARSHPGYTGHDMAILRSRDPMRPVRLTAADKYFDFVILSLETAFCAPFRTKYSY